MRSMWKNHPNLLSWAGLALGMVIVVVFSARNVGFQPGQWAAIIVATTILAGLCVWIVSWEDGAAGDVDEPAPDAPSAIQKDKEVNAVTAEGAKAAEPARNGDL